jgi:hypothetical protein
MTSVVGTQNKTENVLRKKREMFLDFWSSFLYCFIENKVYFNENYWALPFCTDISWFGYKRLYNNENEVKWAFNFLSVEKSFFVSGEFFGQTICFQKQEISCKKFGWDLTAFLVDRSSNIFYSASWLSKFLQTHNLLKTTFISS